MNPKKPNLSNLRLWGPATYKHNTSHKLEKLDTRVNKCLYICYSEHSKGYVFIGQQNDGIVIEIESSNVNFLEEDFLSRGEVCRDVKLYKMHDPQEDTSSSLVENEEVIPQAPKGNGSNLLNHGIGPTNKDLQDSQLRRSKREAILCCLFKIKGETCMTALSDD